MELFNLNLMQDDDDNEDQEKMGKGEKPPLFKSYVDANEKLVYVKKEDF